MNMDFNLMSKIIKLFRILYADIKLNKARKGKRVVACRKLNVRNPEYFAIGDYCYFGSDCRIEAWNKYNDRNYNPEIIIGRDVRINSTCHIGAINKIVIGDECLLGSHVMIIDHSHGKNEFEEMKIHPSSRDLFSKGEIVIGEKCWLCENVVILPGVHIGECCVIAANSVVTKDIPAYSVAAGNPARVVKSISG